MAAKIKDKEIATPSSQPQEIDEKAVVGDDSMFSYSRISLFKKCPKAYQFKYLLKKDELFSTIEQHLGKSIHTTLEYYYTKKKNGNNISFNSLINAFDQAWNSPELKNAKVVKNNMNSRDYYLDGQDMLKKYYHRVLTSDRSETVATEKYFEINIDNSTYYRGYIDRISKNSDGMLRITDFKTGKNINNPLEDMQLCSYALWYFEESIENKIEIAFEALRHEKTLLNTIKRTKVPIIKNKLKTDINYVMTAAEFEANPSILCYWCGYSPICSQANNETSRYNYKGNENYSGNADECLWCGSALEERNGRYGTFIGCTRFPNCRYTRDDW